MCVKDRWNVERWNVRTFSDWGTERWDSGTLEQRNVGTWKRWNVFVLVRVLRGGGVWVVMRGAHAKKSRVAVPAAVGV